MKTTKILILFVSLITLSACGDDETINIHTPTPPISEDTSANDNKNTTGPIEAQTRYEFPKLQGGNNITIVHKGVINQKISLEGVNYSVEWDPNVCAQRWSCYQLYKSINISNVSRYNADNTGSLLPGCQYPNDLDLDPKYQLSADPYKYNGFDHGHICPSADRLGSSEANYQTFYITNMQPQYSNFNGSNSNSTVNQRSPWYRLESQIRNVWATEVDTLYICKGGTIREDQILKYLTDKIKQENKIPVPKYFFVALFGKKNSTYKAIGFWMEHKSEYEKQEPLSTYACCIDDLENLTGIDFFCNLPDKIEKEVEKSFSANDWKGNLQ